MPEEGLGLSSFEDLIKRLVKALNDAQTDYMFTGALAASFYGLPRTTADIDIVIDFSLKDTRLLAEQLKKAGLRATERKIETASKSGFRIVSVEDETTPFTVDLILFNGLLEKKTGRILGMPTYFQSPEDLILAKLNMIKVTMPKERALKDKDDIKAILKYTRVDMNLIKKKALKEKTLAIFEELLCS